jgi:hypothetical protein
LDVKRQLVFVQVRADPGLPSGFEPFGCNSGLITHWTLSASALLKENASVL